MTDHIDPNEGARGPVVCGKPAGPFFARCGWFARCCIWSGSGAIIMLLVAALGVGAFFWRLSEGPIEIDLIGQKLQQSIAERLGADYQVSVGPTRIENGEHGPELTIAGLSLRNAAGHEIISAPKAAFGIEPLPLLLGKVLLKRIDLEGVKLHLILLPDHNIAVAAGADTDDAVPLNQLFAAPADPAPTDVASQPTSDPANVLSTEKIANQLAALFAVASDRNGPLGSLKRLGISDSLLIIDDRAANRAATFKSVDIALDRAYSSSTAFSVAADGGNGRWSLNIDMQTKADAVKTLNIETQNLSLDDIKLAAGLGPIGVDFDMPISAKLRLRLAPDGSLADAEGQYAFGEGYFLADDPEFEPILVDKFTGRLHWDKQQERIDVDEARLLADGTDFTLAGFVQPPQSDGAPWNFSLESQNATIGAERPHEQPIAVSKLEFSGLFMPRERSLTINRFIASGPEVSVSIAGVVQRTDLGVRMRFGMNVGAMPATVVVRLWPEMIVPKVRGWFLTNVLEGRLEHGSMQLDYDEKAVDLIRSEHPPPDDAFHMDFTLSDVKLIPARGLPALTGVDGVGALTGHTATFNVSKGLMDLGQGRKLSVLDGSFFVPDEGVKPNPPATVTAHIQGSADSLADLLMRDVVKKYSGLNIDPAAVKGQVDGHLVLDFKLGTPPGHEQVTPRATATLTNLSVDKLIGDEKLEGATINVNLDQGGLKAQGDGKLLGVPASIDMHRPQDGSGETVLSFVMDDAARAKRGFNLGPGISGPIGVKLTAPLGTKPGDQKAQLDLDLAHTNIDNPIPGLVKPANRPAKASALISQKSGDIMLDQIVFDAGAASFRGAAELADDGSLVSAKFSQARLSAGDDMKLDLTDSGDDLKIVARGNALDARPFLQGLLNAGNKARADQSGKTIDVDLKSTLLTGYNSQVLSNAEIKTSLQAATIRDLQLKGKFGRDNLTARIAKGGNVPILSIMSEDAGSLLSFLDYYRHMEGGQLNVDLRISDARYDGTVTIKDFSLRDEPAMRKLVSQGVANGSDERGNQATKIDASSVPFTKLNVNLSRANGRIDLRDGVMWGPLIGATVDGYVDFGQNKVSLGGTFVPAYSVNNLFAKVPVVGMLLGGSSHEGLFGVNYTVSGSVSAPVLSFNPLSAIAPGFLRKIFGAIDGSGATSSITPPAYAPEQ